MASKTINVSKWTRICLSLALLSLWSGSARAEEVSKSDLPPILTQSFANFKHQNPTKAGKTLKKAYDALQQEKFALAIREAGRLFQEDLYADHALWVAALATREQAVQELKLRHPSKAMAKAKKAISLLQRIEGKNAYSPWIRRIPKEMSLAEVILAGAEVGAHKWKQAQKNFEQAFQRLASQNALQQLDPDSIEQYAESCSRIPSPVCRPWLGKFLNYFSKQSQQIERILKFHPTLQEQLKAVKVPSYGRLSQSYKSPDADQAAFDAAMKLYLDQKNRQSIKEYQEFLKNYPRSGLRFRAKYWLAQALNHDGENEKAQGYLKELRQEAPLGFYGLLAAIQTGELPGTLPNGVSQGVNDVNAQAADTAIYLETDPSLTASEWIHLSRAENLLVHDLDSLAAVELSELRPRSTFSNGFLVYLALLNYRVHSYSQEFQMGTELIQREYAGIYSALGVQLIFPVEYQDWVKQFSEQSVLDPILVLSLIKQESAFNEQAISSSGAIGLMQLMPATALDTEPALKLKELFNAKNNILVGTKYLKKMLVHFGGNIVLALAGYNAGPSAVDRWVKDMPQKQGMLEFIESIPFKETREYVTSIIRNYFWYSRMILGTQKRDLDYFWNPATFQPIDTILKQRSENALRRRHARRTLYLPNGAHRHRE